MLTRYGRQTVRERFRGVLSMSSKSRGAHLVALPPLDISSIDEDGLKANLLFVRCLEGVTSSNICWSSTT